MKLIFTVVRRPFPMLVLSSRGVVAVDGPGTRCQLPGWVAAHHTWTSLDTNISREHQKVGISMLLIILIKYQRRLPMPCFAAVVITLYESTP